jgi:hypothetical protein
VLTPRIKKAVYDEIVNVGLDPSRFAWSEVQVQDGEAEIHRLVSTRNSDFYFAIVLTDGHLHSTARHFAGSSSETQEYVMGSTRNEEIRELRRQLRVWLRVVKVEDVLDPWESLDESGDTIDAKQEWPTGNEPFTPLEIGRVQNAIESVKTQLLELAEVRGQHQELVEERLESLRDNVSKVGRKDFALLALGTVLSFGLQIGLQPAALKTAWKVLETAIVNAPRLIP